MALELSADDEAALGERGGDFYAIYCRGLDGEKLAF